MSEELPERVSERMSEEMAEIVSEDMSGRMSDRMSERLSGRMSERMSRGMPERMSGDMPEWMSERIWEIMSDAVPGAVANMMLYRSICDRQDQEGELMGHIIKPANQISVADNLEEPIHKMPHRVQTEHHAAQRVLMSIYTVKKSKRFLDGHLPEITTAMRMSTRTAPLSEDQLAQLRARKIQNCKKELATDLFKHGHVIGMYWENIARSVVERANRDVQELDVPLFCLQAADKRHSRKNKDIDRQLTHQLLTVPNPHRTGKLQGIVWNVADHAADAKTLFFVELVHAEFKFDLKVGEETEKIEAIRWQFPLLHGMLRTAYSAQGLPLDGGVLVDLRGSGGLDDADSWLAIYVMLVRGRKLKSLILLGFAEQVEDLWRRVPPATTGWQVGSQRCFDVYEELQTSWHVALPVGPNQFCLKRSGEVVLACLWLVNAKASAHVWASLFAACKLSILAQVVRWPVLDMFYFETSWDYYRWLTGLLVSWGGVLTCLGMFVCLFAKHCAQHVHFVLTCVLFTPNFLTGGARRRIDMFLACLPPASAQCEWCMVMCGWYLCMVLCEWCRVQWREPGAILWSNISVGENSETCASVSTFPQHDISKQPRGCFEMSWWGSLEVKNICDLSKVRCWFGLVVSMPGIPILPLADVRSVRIQMTLPLWVMKFQFNKFSLKHVAISL